MASPDAVKFTGAADIRCPACHVTRRCSLRVGDVPPATWPCECGFRLRVDRAEFLTAFEPLGESVYFPHHSPTVVRLRRALREIKSTLACCTVNLAYTQGLRCKVCGEPKDDHAETCPIDCVESLLQGDDHDA